MFSFTPRSPLPSDTTRHASHPSKIAYAPARKDLDPLMGIGQSPRCTPKQHTKVPLSSNNSIFLHQGFWDLLGMASTLKGSPQTPRVMHATSVTPVSLNASKKVHISRDMISRPTGFLHLCHASDVDQADAILSRWEVDGVGKLADPAWVTSIKELARARARAQGIAEVQVNRDLQYPGTLRIVNPANSDKMETTLQAQVQAQPHVFKRPLPSVPVSVTTTSPALSQNDTAATVVVRAGKRPPLLTTEEMDPEHGSPFKQAPSLESLEKTAAVAIYFEQLYHNILKRPRDRDQRAHQLEVALQNLPEPDRRLVRTAWMTAESEYLRELRARVSPGAFVKLKTIGHGAFGVLTLVREKGTGWLYAMKQLRKADMLRKGQEGHVRAERDFLAQASQSTRWITRLAYSFQDVDHLYLVMEWMAGGDMLNLLIEKDRFEEPFARFYVAEMILGIEEAHKLGYIHRDIKPDNFLIDSSGHLKLGDFGLATDFHWAHDGAYYDQQRKALLRRHGVDLDDGNVTDSVCKRQQRPGTEQDSKKDTAEHILTWRERNRRELAYSVVGTNNYMAPEVLRGRGYDKSFISSTWACTSSGFIGLSVSTFPCFVSKSRHVTRQKILNWRQHLRFPAKPAVSREAQDFIEKLVCEREDRLGSTSPGASQLSQDDATRIKAHPWFRGIDFATLHLQTPPFVPNLTDETDTRYFEDDIPDEPLAPVDGQTPEQATKDPLLRDGRYGQQLLQVRKALAFAGYTFRKPRKSVHDLRYGLLPDSFKADDARGQTMSRSSLMRSLSL